MSEQLLKTTQNKQHGNVTCPYCGAALQQRHAEYYCNFCSMQLDRLDTHRNGERIPPRKVRTILGVHLSKSTPELMEFSTFELLQLLKLAREEREEAYHLLHTIADLQQTEGKKRLRKEERMSYKEFEKITRKTFAIETLLQERLDFIPRKITEEALERYEEKLYDAGQRYI